MCNSEEYSDYWYNLESLPWLCKAARSFTNIILILLWNIFDLEDTLKAPCRCLGGISENHFKNNCSRTQPLLRFKRLEYRGHKGTVKEEKKSRLSGRHLKETATFALAHLALTSIPRWHLIEAIFHSLEK